MNRSFAALFAMVSAVGCGASDHAPSTPASSDPGSTDAHGAGSASTSLHELEPAEKVLVFEGYDGPKGKLDHVPAEAWTVTPVTSEEGCSYKGPVLSKQRVIGTKGGLVVLELKNEPKCHFAVPPSLLVPGDASALAPGAVVFVNGDVGADYARVESVSGDEVHLLVSYGTSMEMKFDEKITTLVAKRSDVLPLKDGLGYGARVMVPTGAGPMLASVFTATDEAVFVAQPFHTKFVRSECHPLSFTAPIADGATVTAIRGDQNGVTTAKVVRSRSGMVYDLQSGKGPVWTAAFQDVGKQL